MPNTDEVTWAGLALPSRWAKDYAARARQSGRSIGREIMIDLALYRGEPVPVTRGRGRPRKKPSKV